MPLQVQSGKASLPKQRRAALQRAASGSRNCQLDTHHAILFLRSACVFSCVCSQHDKLSDFVPNSTRPRRTCFSPAKPMPAPAAAAGQPVSQAALRDAPVSRCAIQLGQSFDKRSMLWTSAGVQGRAQFCAEDLAFEAWRIPIQCRGQGQLSSSRARPALSPWGSAGLRTWGQSILQPWARPCRLRHVPCTHVTHADARVAPPPLPPRPCRPAPPRPTDWRRQRPVPKGRALCQGPSRYAHRQVAAGALPHAGWLRCALSPPCVQALLCACCDCSKQGGSCFFGCSAWQGSGRVLACLHPRAVPASSNPCPARPGGHHMHGACPPCTWLRGPEAVAAGCAPHIYSAPWSNAHHHHRQPCANPLAWPLMQ